MYDYDGTKDTDRDGICNSCELNGYHRGNLGPGFHGYNGFWNIRSMFGGLTNPFKENTDQDGFSDSEELKLCMDLIADGMPSEQAFLIWNPLENPHAQPQALNYPSSSDERESFLILRLKYKVLIRVSKFMLKILL